MKHNIINERNESTYEKVVDVEILLNDEDINNISKQNWAFTFPLNIKIGTVKITKEI